MSINTLYKTQNIASLRLMRNLAHMFGWLKKVKDGRLVGEVLGTDWHAHWLPGIDDGAEGMEQSMAMLRRYEAMGYEKLVATPHIMAGVYENTPETILRTLERTRQAARKEGIRLVLEAGAEYMVDDGFAGQLEAPLLCLRDKCVLIEQSYMQEYPGFRELLFELQLQGYTPVLAHPERYFFWHSRKLDVYEDLHDRGCLFQLNALSLQGYYGKEVKRVARRILGRGWYSLAGSDAHSLKHLDLLAKGPVAEVEGLKW